MRRQSGSALKRIEGHLQKERSVVTSAGLSVFRLTLLHIPRLLVQYAPVGSSDNNEVSILVLIILILNRTQKTLSLPLHRARFLSRTKRGEIECCQIV
jgi:hypothetical protein